MVVKTDRKDARGIAQLLRMGWFRPLLGLAFLLFVVVNKFRYRRGGPAASLALRRAI